MKIKIQGNNIKNAISKARLLEPRLIRIGVSRLCNFNCIMCRGYSPLLKRIREKSWKKVMINEDLALRTIKEVNKIGFNRILFSGFGEPFTHPNMLDFIKIAAEEQNYIIVQTNLSLVDPFKLIKVLEKERKNCRLCVNFGASSLEVYRKIYLGSSKGEFYDTLNKIKFLLKNHINIRIVYTVNKFNYQGIAKMIDLNKKLGSFLHLELTDFIKGSGVESIIIGENEKKEILKKFSFMWGKDRQSKSNISEFLGQINYQGIGMNKIKHCLIGYNFCTIDEIGNVQYCFNNAERFFMGNLSQRSFKEIWFSRKYNTMRKTLRDGRFFKECDHYCTKSCDSNNSRGSNFKLRGYIDSDIPMLYG